MTVSPLISILRDTLEIRFNMKEETFIEADYVKGFNEGYMLAKYAPELAEQLAKATGTGSRLEGAKDAHEVYLSEQFEKHRPDWLRGRSSGEPKDHHNPTKQKNLDRDL